MKTISQLYSSENNPIPNHTEQWLERLPLCDKILLATAILDQCKPAFAYIPSNRLSVVKPSQFSSDAS